VNYDGMAALSRDDAASGISRPHAWQAAEMFLYLAELGPFPDLSRYKEWP
jgi:hypothetical protein